ncbi:MAG: anti-sigma factor [Actinomycetota bacterium]
MIDHDVIEERIVAYVLGGMDPIERASFEAEFAEHRPGCERCTRLYSDYSEVSSRLALAAPAVAPPADLEDRIMALATGRHVSSATRTAAPRWRRVALGIAAALVLVAGSVAATLALTGSSEGLRITQLRGAAGFTLAYVSGSDDAVIVPTDAPPLGPGRVYQLWLRVDGRMLGSGTFGTEAAPIELAAEDFDLVAVTDEPVGGSPQPTTDPIASSEIG